MSKELPSTHGTTGTFGIPIDRSWYRYEQDFNTVLSPPPLVPPPYFQLPPGTVGKLKKSYSQPSMNVGAITLTSREYEFTWFYQMPFSWPKPEAFISVL